MYVKLASLASASCRVGSVIHSLPRITMNRFEVDTLDELMPGFGLGAYLREVGAGGDTVCIDNPGFYREVDAALAETPIETLRVALRWHLVRACASSLPPAFEDENFAFYGRILGGQQEQQPRWKRVIAAADADIGEAVAQLFVAVAFPPEAKARCEELVEHLIHAMERAIRANDVDAVRPTVLLRNESQRHRQHPFAGPQQIDFH